MDIDMTPIPRHRTRLLVILLITILVSATAAQAERRLALEVEPKELSPGQKAILHIRILDQQGRPAVAAQSVLITIEGGEDLVQDGVEIAAGQGQADIPFAPTEPGIWKVEVTAEGHRPAERWILVPKPLPQRPEPQPTESDAFWWDDAHALHIKDSRTHNRSLPIDIAVPQTVTDEELSRVVESLGDIRFEENTDKWELGPDALTVRDRLMEASRDHRGVRIPAAGVDRASLRYLISGLPGVEQPLEVVTGDDPWPQSLQIIEFGEVRLYPQPESPRFPEQGQWDDVEVFAVWITKEGENEVPERRPSPLSVKLELRDYVRKPTLNPHADLIIPEGESYASAFLTTDTAQTVRVGARWRSGRTDPLEVSFLPAPASRLVFRDLPPRVSGVGPLRRSVGLGLVDDMDADAVSDIDLDVIIRWDYEGHDGMESAVIPAGHHDHDIEVVLPESGSYTLTARTRHGQLTHAKGKIEYEFNYWLVIVALLGGLLGALVSAVFRGDRNWVRGAIVGLGATFVAVLLALFGLLGLLEAALPNASMIQDKVPVQTTLGMLLLALLAALAGEAIIGLYALGSGRNRAALAPTKPATQSQAKARRTATRPRKTSQVRGRKEHPS